jgi:hypothetical protein
MCRTMDRGVDEFGRRWRGLSTGLIGEHDPDPSRRRFVGPPNEIKSQHEAGRGRAQRVLESMPTQPEPVRIVDDSRYGSVSLKLLLSGKDVWDVVLGADAYLMFGPVDETSPSAEAVDAVDEFLDQAKDAGDISRKRDRACARRAAVA